MKPLNFEFTLSDEAFDLLVKIAKEGYVEYRDPAFPTVDDFISPENVTLRGRPIDSTDVASFLSRNAGGTYHLIDELLKYGLVDSDDNAWHDTWQLSEFGKLVLIFNEIDYKNI